MKSVIRDVYVSALAGFGLLEPHRWAKGSLLILTFHRVLPREHRDVYPLPGLAVTPDELKWVIETLRPHFECLTVSEAWERLSHQYPSKPLLAVTFDDGQLDNFEFAAPVLAELGVRATFYVPTGFVGGDELLWHDRVAFSFVRNPGPTRAVLDKFAIPGHGGVDDVTANIKALNSRAFEELLDAIRRIDVSPPKWAGMMNWTQVRTLRDSGHEIGSHAVSHKLLDSLAQDEQQREIENSTSALLSQLGTAPSSFCYPNGNATTFSASLIQTIGYRNAVTTKWGTNSISSNPFALMRCDIDARHLYSHRGFLSRSLLMRRLSPFRPTSLAG